MFRWGVLACLCTLSFSSPARAITQEEAQHTAANTNNRGSNDDQDEAVRNAMMALMNLAALNIPAQVRLNQLSTNLTRLKMSLAKPLPQRFVMVNIPAAAVEAVEAQKVVSRHTAIVGKVDRPSPIVNSVLSLACSGTQTCRVHTR